MRINKMINAAITATRDRRYITRASKKELTGLDLKFYTSLKEHTGESVHNPIQVIKNWKRAYNKNLQTINLVEDLNKPFKKPSIIKQIFHRLTNK